jgi:hypothetical protein
VRGKRFRPDNGIIAPRLNPVSRRVEQSTRGFLIITDFKRAKPANMVLIGLVVPVVDKGGDGSDNLITSPGGEIRSSCEIISQVGEGIIG